jgi:alcohol dehydrogenase (cytochrome c)
MKRISIVLLLVAVAGLPGVTQNQRAPFVPVTDAMIQKPDPASWLMWRRTLDSWGYSPLDQVNRSNVARLRMVWTRGMGPGNIQEATPLVYNGVMYVPNPSDYIAAMDARTGDLLWEYKRELPADLGKFMPAFVINRNLAIYGTTIIDTSADDFVFALDAQTGKLAWETKILDYHKGRAADLGAHHRQREDHLGPRLRAGGWARRLRDHGA